MPELKKSRENLRQVRRHQVMLTRFGRRRDGSETAAADAADGFQERVESAVAVAVQGIGEAAFRLHLAQEAAIADLRRQLGQELDERARALAIARKVCDLLEPLEARLAEHSARLV